MEINITLLFKLLKYMNKKSNTLIPILDDYIFIENGNFIVQDAFKTCVLSIDEIKDKGNYFINKNDLSKAITKNAKYFLEDMSSEGITISIKTNQKDKTVKTDTMTIPITKRSINLSKIIEAEYVFTNQIETNGVDLKKFLKGCTDDITLKFSDDKVYLAMGDNNGFVSFNEEFSPPYYLNAIKSNDIVVQTTGQHLSESLGHLGLVSKNAMATIKFNENAIEISNTNLKIYILSNKI